MLFKMVRAARLWHPRQSWQNLSRIKGVIFHEVSSQVTADNFCAKKRSLTEILFCPELMFYRNLILVRQKIQLKRKTVWMKSEKGDKLFWKHIPPSVFLSSFVQYFVGSMLLVSGGNYIQTKNLLRAIFNGLFKIHLHGCLRYHACLPEIKASHLISFRAVPHHNTDLITGLGVHTSTCSVSLQTWVHNLAQKKGKIGDRSWTIIQSSIFGQDHTCCCKRGIASGQNSILAMEGKTQTLLYAEWRLLVPVRGTFSQREKSLQCAHRRELSLEENPMRPDKTSTTDGWGFSVHLRYLTNIFALVPFRCHANLLHNFKATEIVSQQRRMQRHSLLATTSHVFCIQETFASLCAS